MSPFDPRYESTSKLAVQSGPHTAPTRNMNEEILLKLDSLATSLGDVRDAQKNSDIKLDALATSHGDHRVSLNELRSQCLELGQRVLRVETRSENANQMAIAVNKRVSDTQHEFESTIAAISSRTTATLTKTDSVAAETSLQTGMLQTIQTHAYVAAEAAEAAKRRFPKVVAFLSAASATVAFGSLELFKAWLRSKGIQI